MIYLQNKNTGKSFEALQVEDSIVVRLISNDWCLTLDATEFLLQLNTYSIDWSGWEKYIMLYGGIKAFEGDWILKDENGFYFVITDSCKKELYTDFIL